MTAQFGLRQVFLVTQLISNDMRSSNYSNTEKSNCLVKTKSNIGSTENGEKNSLTVYHSVSFYDSSRSAVTSLLLQLTAKKIVSKSFLYDNTRPVRKRVSRFPTRLMPGTNCCKASTA